MGRALALAMLIAGCGHSGDDYPIYNPPNIDAAVSCGKVTCASLGATCGVIGDGCGDVTTDCGACPDGEVCGGGAGTPFQCGANPCTLRTCDDVGANCGRIADGCGGLTASCGSCAASEVCGGGGVANRCGTPPCTGLCLQQQACPSAKTTLTGTVTAPGHPQPSPFGPADPIFGALVYVPNGADGPPAWGVTPFAPGVACETCISQLHEPPLVSTTTAVDGSFTLPNAPCGANIPLVIQLGRWRRMITIPSVACCASTALTAAQTHLPRTRTGEPGDVRSDIPLIAVSTGAVDTAHCVLRKMGIADSEFTNPGGAGRVRMYKDNGAEIDDLTPPGATLYATAAELGKYDMTLFECVGGRDAKSDQEQARLIAYANGGGRVFATHYSYVWLTDSDGTPNTNTAPKPWSQTATWNVDQLQSDTATAVVDQTPQGDPETQARRIAFAQWLLEVGASPSLGAVPLTDARHDFDAVSATPATAAATPAQKWLTTTEPFAAPVQYTFDTPVAYAPSARPTKRCGRVAFSDFHVSIPQAGDAMFPHECADSPMTPQEKTLEFLLFDLATCIGPPPTACTPKSCAEQGFDCGVAGDGCDDGVILSCGTCSNGRTCGGGGVNHCGTGACEAQTCATAGWDCGTAGDGCGGVVECGTCPQGETCGGGDAPNQCALILK